MSLADDLLAQSAAATLGKKGGKQTAKRHGPDYFRKIAAMGRERKGGRPTKESTPN